MKKTRQILSVFLSLCVIISCMTGITFTSTADWTGTGDGTAQNPWLIGSPTPANVKADYNSDNGTLTFFGKGSIQDFVEGSPWNPNLNNIELSNIDFREGITTIGNQCFYNCTISTSLNLPSTLITIGNLAFYKCNFPNNSIDLPSNLKTIGISAFQFSDLKSLTLH